MAGQHRPGPIGIVVAALVRDGRVLLVHRHPDRRNYPDCWDLPGGHVEDGEAPETAVRRECREELGVELHDVRPFALACSNPQLDKRAFVVTAWTGTPANLAPDEHDDLAWFTAGELAGLTTADPLGLGEVAALLRRSDDAPDPGTTPRRE